LSGANRASPARANLGAICAVSGAIEQAKGAQQCAPFVLVRGLNCCRPCNRRTTGVICAERCLGCEILRHLQARGLQRRGRCARRFQPRQLRLDGARHRLAEHAAEIDRPVAVRDDVERQATQPIALAERRLQVTTICASRGFWIVRVGKRHQHRPLRFRHVHRRCAGKILDVAKADPPVPRADQPRRQKACVLEVRTVLAIGQQQDKVAPLAEFGQQGVTPRLRHARA